MDPPLFKKTWICLRKPPFPLPKFPKVHGFTNQKKHIFSIKNINVHKHQQQHLPRPVWLANLWGMKAPATTGILKHQATVSESPERDLPGPLHGNDTPQCQGIPERSKRKETKVNFKSIRVILYTYIYAYIHIYIYIIHMVYITIYSSYMCIYIIYSSPRYPLELLQQVPGTHLPDECQWLDSVQLRYGRGWKNYGLW